MQNWIKFLVFCTNNYLQSTFIELVEYTLNQKEIELLFKGKAPKYKILRCSFKFADNVIYFATPSQRFKKSYRIG